MNNLGSILRERRKAKGLTLWQLSSEAAISPSYLARIEKGERFPSGFYLRRLAAPLGFRELELFKLAGFISEDAVERIEKVKCPHCGGLNPLDVVRCIYCRGNVRG